MEVVYDIDGDQADAIVHLSLLTGRMPEWKGLRAEVMEEVRVKNRSSLKVAGLAPGIYEVVRGKVLFLGTSGRGKPIDLTSVTLEPGKSFRAEFVRPAGSRISGQVRGLESLAIPGAFLRVTTPDATGNPRDPKELSLPAFDFLTCGPDGRFQTARIPPGTYEIVAEAYPPGPPAGAPVSTGISLPTHVGTAKVVVPSQGEAPVVRIDLQPLKK